MKQQPKLEKTRRVKKIEYPKKELEEEELPKQDEDGIEVIPWNKSISLLLNNNPKRNLLQKKMQEIS